MYTIDPSEIPPGVVRVAKSHWNDGRLVTEWQMERNGEVVMRGTDARSLTTDGLQIVDRLIESPRHHAEVHLVMERVPLRPKLPCYGLTVATLSDSVASQRRVGLRLKANERA